jgi:hypothetical protein
MFGGRQFSFIRALQSLFGMSNPARSPEMERTGRETVL